jgi:4-hydroxybenzoate polyprenyltransferase
MVIGNKMIYLKIIRWQNLIMIILLQYLLRYCMALPILEMQNLGLLLTDSEFFILSISCVLIAAGGYVINDIEDVNIDRINKSEQQIIGRKMDVNTAYNYYLLLTFSGVSGGLYLTYVKDYSYVFYVNLISAGLLYFYSTSYKCIPVIGNLIVGLLSSIVVFMVILNEPFARNDQSVMLMIGVFMLFSFLTTVLREFIKDIEDEEGDLSCDCQTLANTLGMNRSKWIAISLTLVVVCLLLTTQIVARQWESLLPFLYLVALVDIPLTYVVFLLYKARDKAAFKKAGNWLKMAMFAFITSLIVYYYNFNL